MRLRRRVSVKHAATAPCYPHSLRPYKVSMASATCFCLFRLFLPILEPVCVVVGVGKIKRLLATPSGRCSFTCFAVHLSLVACCPCHPPESIFNIFSVCRFDVEKHTVLEHTPLIVKVVLTYEYSVHLYLESTLQVNQNIYIHTYT